MKNNLDFSSNKNNTNLVSSMNKKVHTKLTYCY